MTNRKLKKRIRQAFQNATPDLAGSISVNSLLCDIEPKKGDDKPMKPIRTSIQFRAIATLAASIAVVALVATILSIATPFTPANQPSGTTAPQVDPVDTDGVIDAIFATQNLSISKEDAEFNINKKMFDEYVFFDVFVTSKSSENFDVLYYLVDPETKTVHPYTKDFSWGSYINSQYFDLPLEPDSNFDNPYNAFYAENVLYNNRLCYAMAVDLGNKGQLVLVDANTSKLIRNWTLIGSSKAFFSCALDDTEIPTSDIQWDWNFEYHEGKLCYDIESSGSISLEAVVNAVTGEVIQKNGYGTDIKPTDPIDQTDPDNTEGPAVTVSIVSVGTSIVSDQLWLFEQIENRFGCNIEIINILPEDYNEWIRQKLKTNDLPTIFQLSGDYEEYIRLGEEGAFVDLMAPENLEKMPNFANIFVNNKEVYQEYMMTGAEDGSHYILPAYDLERHVNHYWVYEEKAFEEAGVEWAGDPEGFLDMLRKLKAYYPDSYPLTGSTWEGTLNRVCYTFNINGSFAAYDWDNGEWYYGATTDAYYDMLKMFQTAYNEGLMNPETLTQGSGSINNDIYSGKSFVYNSWLGWMTANNVYFNSGDQNKHLIPAPTPVGPNGKTIEIKKFNNTGGTIISAADPEASACAMAIMDWMYDISKDGGAWLNSVGPDEALETDKNGRLRWNVTVANKYGILQGVFSVRYCPESPYYSYDLNEEYLAQEIGDRVGYFRAPPILSISDSNISELYADSQSEIIHMQVQFIIDNWDKQKFDTWAAEFMDKYGEVIDYLNS